MDDLERAAETLRSGVLKYGFQFASARSVLPALVESSVTGEAAFRQVQSNPAWRGALEQEYEATMKTIQRNRPLIEAIQRRLLRNYVVFREEFEMLWSRHVSTKNAVPLMGCNSTVNLKSRETVLNEAPSEFHEWLHQGR